MRGFPRPPRDLVVIAPHPDDEVIGAFGLIRRTIAAGGRARVVIVTDGAASHRNSAAFPPARLARTRRGEARRALARMGLAAGALTWLGLPDGGLDSLCPAAGRKARRRLARFGKADAVVLPVADDAHPDHRDARALTLAALPRVARWGFVVWGARAARDRRLGLGAARAVKATALRAHRTQLGAVRDDPEGFTIDRATFARFTRPSEAYSAERRGRRG